MHPSLMTRGQPLPDPACEGRGHRGPLGDLFPPLTGPQKACPGTSTSTNTNRTRAGRTRAGRKRADRKRADRKRADRKRADADQLEADP